MALAYFVSLFPNRIQGILRPSGCKTWTTVSKHWPIPDETIRSAVAGEEASVWGLRWGQQTRFAVLDVDRGSKYHSPLELQKLQTKLAAVELKATTYRSSESGGWHVYIFWQDWADCHDVQETLKAWLYSQGYEIRNGTLEVFPSGNGLRLPLQPGFAWLDANGEAITERKELAADAAISRFLFDLENNTNNWEKSKSLIKAQLETIDRAAGGDVLAHRERLEIDGFEGLFNYRLIPEKYEEGRRAWREGLTKNGQRHDAILGIEHYLWHGDPSIEMPALPGEWNDEQRYRLILAWLEAKHNGFCNHINRGNWRKVEAQIRRAVKWRRPSGAVQVRTPYLLTERSIERLIGRSKATGRTWTPEDFKKGNDGRELQAREKIREALQLLTDQGRRVTGRQLMRLTGCSYHTVKRHLDIWKISPVVALPRAAGDKNPFLVLDLLGGGGTGSGGPAGSEKISFTPPLDEDSGDLGCVQDLPAQDGLGCLEQLEQAASLCSAVAPPSPPQAAATFCLVADSAEQPGELAPIDFGCLLSCADRQVAKARESDGMETAESLASPSRTQPSTGSKHWLWGSVSTCGLNGFLPSCAEPPLGPLHLNPREIFSKGSGLVLLQDDGGSSRAGAQTVAVAGGCLLFDRPTSDGRNKQSGLVWDNGAQAGQVSCTGVHPPADPQYNLSCLQFCVMVSRFSASAQKPQFRRDSGCRQFLDKRLWIRLGHDVRGPPSVDKACIAILANVAMPPQKPWRKSG